MCEERYGPFPEIKYLFRIDERTLTFVQLLRIPSLLGLATIRTPSSFHFLFLSFKRLSTLFITFV